MLCASAGDCSEPCAAPHVSARPGMLAGMVDRQRVACVLSPGSYWLRWSPDCTARAVRRFWWKLSATAVRCDGVRVHCGRGQRRPAAWRRCAGCRPCANCCSAAVMIGGAWGFLRQIGRRSGSGDVCLIGGLGDRDAGVSRSWQEHEAIAPHFERYGICLVAPASLVLARGLSWWLEPAHVAAERRPGRWRSPPGCFRSRSRWVTSISSSARAGFAPRVSHGGRRTKASGTGTRS